jgi:C1A family cysteine protease
MKYAVGLLVVLLAATTFAAQSEDSYRVAFTSFMREHGKVYSHDEFSGRYKTFKNNLDIINYYNSKPNASFKLAMNKFGDLTKEEFKSIYTGLKVANKVRNEVTLSTVGLPSTVDWRKQNAVTPIKNQGQCGSCWSFSTTGSLEGLNAIHNHNLLSFSEQQLVDCSGDYGNNGCDGGLMDNAFKYVAAEGIELESTYPYTAQDGTCQYKSGETKFKNTGFKDVTANQPDQLQAAVAQHPVSIAIEADQSCFQFYTSGVLDDASCGTNLDHGVLIVGYGTQGGKDYWIVKNSWGTSWGMEGYIYIERSSGQGICGINMMPSYPTL